MTQARLLSVARGLFGFYSLVHEIVCTDFGRAHHRLWVTGHRRPTVLCEQTIDFVRLDLLQLGKLRRHLRPLIETVDTTGGSELGTRVLCRVSGHPRRGVTGHPAAPGEADDHCGDAGAHTGPDPAPFARSIGCPASADAEIIIGHGLLSLFYPGMALHYQNAPPTTLDRGNLHPRLALQWKEAE